MLNQCFCLCLQSVDPIQKYVIIDKNAILIYTLDKEKIDQKVYSPFLSFHSVDTSEVSQVLNPDLSQLYVRSTPLPLTFPLGYSEQ